MRFAIAAALALAVPSSLAAQDLGTATPLGGNWAYSTVTGGSEAVFTDAYSRPQLWVHCTRATRRVSITKPAATASPFLTVWTSSQSRQVAASFSPTTARLTIELGVTDSLLDAIAASRGRIGVGVTGQPPLVVPPWAEIARVIEDCRV
ncbi:MAG: hypothetical protein V4502_10405 [Pseudomonadota bacterium]